MLFFQVQVHHGFGRSGSPELGDWGIHGLDGCLRYDRIPVRSSRVKERVLTIVQPSSYVYVHTRAPLFFTMLETMTML